MTEAIFLKSITISLSLGKIFKSNRTIAGQFTTKEVIAAVLSVNGKQPVEANLPVYVRLANEAYPEDPLQVHDVDNNPIGDILIQSSYATQWSINCSKLSDFQFDFICEAYFQRYGVDLCFKFEDAELEFLSENDYPHIVRGKVTDVYFYYSIIAHAAAAEEKHLQNPSIKSCRDYFELISKAGKA